MHLGLDHFARPNDSLAVAAANGGMRRNFQGYTADRADYLIGLGASSISSLPQGFAQNAPQVPQWRAAIGEGRPAMSRGVKDLSDDDRFRSAIIERLMCDLAVDLEAACGQWGRQAAILAWEWDRLAEMECDGMVVLGDRRVTVTEPGRPFLRSVCSVFDRYLSGGESRLRHARAVSSSSLPLRAAVHAGAVHQPRPRAQSARKSQPRRRGL